MSSSYELGDCSDRRTSGSNIRMELTAKGTSEPPPVIYSANGSGVPPAARQLIRVVRRAPSSKFSDETTRHIEAVR
jgi:hypothetical protein